MAFVNVLFISVHMEMSCGWDEMLGDRRYVRVSLNLAVEPLLS